MREIKFRGKRVDNGEWVYGDLRQVEEHAYMLDYDFGDNGVSDIVRIFDIAYSVIPETVGQYTGLKDKNGVEIYEGDIVNRRSGEYWQGCYEFDDTITISDLMDIVTTAEFESLLVIDNIHNNPELLGGAK